MDHYTEALTQYYGEVKKTHYHRLSDITEKYTCLANGISPPKFSKHKSLINESKNRKSKLLKYIKSFNHSSSNDDNHSSSFSNLFVSTIENLTSHQFIEGDIVDTNIDTNVKEVSEEDSLPIHTLDRWTTLFKDKRKCKKVIEKKKNNDLSISLDLDEICDESRTRTMTGKTASPSPIKSNPTEESCQIRCKRKVNENKIQNSQNRESASNSEANVSHGNGEMLDKACHMGRQNDSDTLQTKDNNEVTTNSTYFFRPRRKKFGEKKRISNCKRNKSKSRTVNQTKPVSSITEKKRGVSRGRAGSPKQERSCEEKKMSSLQRSTDQLSSDTTLIKKVTANSQINDTRPNKIVSSIRTRLKTKSLHQSNFTNPQHQNLVNKMKVSTTNTEQQINNNSLKINETHNQSNTPSNHSGTSCKGRPTSRKLLGSKSEKCNDESDKQIGIPSDDQWNLQRKIYQEKNKLHQNNIKISIKKNIVDKYPHTKEHNTGIKVSKISKCNEKGKSITVDPQNVNDEEKGTCENVNEISPVKNSHYIKKICRSANVPSGRKLVLTDDYTIQIVSGFELPSNCIYFFPHKYNEELGESSFTRRESKSPVEGNENSSAIPSVKPSVMDSAFISSPIPEKVSCESSITKGNFNNACSKRQSTEDKTANIDQDIPKEHENHSGFQLPYSPLVSSVDTSSTTAPVPTLQLQPCISTKQFSSPVNGISSVSPCKRKCSDSKEGFIQTETAIQDFIASPPPTTSETATVPSSQYVREKTKFQPQLTSSKTGRNCLTSSNIVMAPSTKILNNIDNQVNSNSYRTTHSPKSSIKQICTEKLELRNLSLRNKENIQNMSRGKSLLRSFLSENSNKSTHSSHSNEPITASNHYRKSEFLFKYPDQPLNKNLLSKEQKKNTLLNYTKECSSGFNDTKVSSCKLIPTHSDEPITASNHYRKPEFLFKYPDQPHNNNLLSKEQKKNTLLNNIKECSSGFKDRPTRVSLCKTSISKFLSDSHSNHTHSRKQIMNHRNGIMPLDIPKKGNSSCLNPVNSNFIKDLIDSNVSKSSSFSTSTQTKKRKLDNDSNYYLFPEEADENVLDMFGITSFSELTKIKRKRHDFETSTVSVPHLDSACVTNLKSMITDFPEQMEQDLDSRSFLSSSRIYKSFSHNYSLYNTSHTSTLRPSMKLKKLLQQQTLS